MHMNLIEFLINASVNKSIEDVLIQHFSHLLDYRTPHFKVIEQDVSIIS